MLVNKISALLISNNVHYQHINSYPLLKVIMIIYNPGSCEQLSANPLNIGNLPNRSLIILLFRCYNATLLSYSDTRTPSSVIQLHMSVCLSVSKHILRPTNNPLSRTNMTFSPEVQYCREYFASLRSLRSSIFLERRNKRCGYHKVYL